MRRPAATVLAVAAAAVGAAPASAQRFTADDRETHLISRAAGGGLPNGASRNPAISHDRQLSSHVAFDSDASDIVAGDGNGLSDVFVVARARPFSLNGEPWRPGRVRIASRALGGGAANGPSYLPDLSGSRSTRPRCLGFVSEASNLVRGDTNGVPDAFVADLGSGRVTRVSVDSRGRQADGPTSEVRVDGDCQRVSFVARASNLALTRTSRRAWRPFRTSAAPAGTRQVYVRMLGSKGANSGLRGLTFLASASNGGRAGNGESFDLSMAKGSSTRGTGEELAFASTATNLAPGDRAAQPDVYMRAFRRGRGAVRVRTTLVSATRAGRPGNGASTQPDIADSGRNVAFRTEATDLLPGDSNGVADVARAVPGRRGSFMFVSRSEAIGAPGNGPSGAPTITVTGVTVFFESDASNLQSTTRNQLFDRNLSGDVFFWNHISRNVSLQSRDSRNEILNNEGNPYGPPPGFGPPPGPGGPRHVPHGAARNPAVSAYANYMLFESPYPKVDLDAAGRFGDLSDTEAAEASNSDPALRQVYLRYIGPR